MAKTIDQILDDLVVPEMEYEPKYDVGKTKSKTQQRVAVTIDEIPEVVLPKTKAEMYREAKGRLKEKTSAASKRDAPHSQDIGKGKNRRAGNRRGVRNGGTRRERKHKADVGAVKTPARRAYLGGRRGGACAVCMAQPACRRHQKAQQVLSSSRARSAIRNVARAPR